MTVTIFQNPSCGTSRNTLAMIRERGIEPVVIDYLKAPPDRARLRTLIDNVGGGARALLREKERAYAELGLADLSLGDDALIDAIIAHPILLNRPIVETPKGTRLCRPADVVLGLL
ncbi:arsenate reductase (glutaredoxin) [Tardiphaga robiniae]|uniref:Arsenate reductase n=1 Tax=Tardiphaga robiniae TaxID=943830 RepID=A0A161SR47_9BRAD|nr:arsenate reductase (glutaredoxin) [Tardiphaga robiniae]KZD23572.1 arsenate reductase (glutaredoxin) [Tardiphaga robiniae]